MGNEEMGNGDAPQGGECGGWEMRMWGMGTLPKQSKFSDKRIAWGMGNGDAPQTKQV